MSATQPLRQPRSSLKKAASPSISANYRTKVSITETCQIAATCRSKLGEEAIRSDLHLRRLVCHANMLDEIMVQLSQTEQEYQAFLESKTCVAPVPHKDPPRLQWMDTISEELEEEDDCDSTNNTAQASCSVGGAKLGTLGSKTRSPPPKPWSNYFDDVDDSDEDSDCDDEPAEDDEESRDDDLSLRRVPTCHRVPDLIYDCDSASEEDEAPPQGASIPDGTGKDRPCLSTKVMLQREPKAGQSPAALQVLVVIKTGV